MSTEDDLLFSGAQTKDRFGGAKISADMQRRNAAAMDGVDVADLIGAGDQTSAGTGFDFGTPAQAPTATTAARTAVHAPAAPPKAAPTPQRRGFFAWLLGLFGLGRR